MTDFHSPMRHISSNARIPTPISQVQQTLDILQTKTKTRNNIIWFFINGSLLSILMVDILYGGVTYKPLFWVELLLALIFALNALYHVVSYIIATLNLRPIVLSLKQKKLLGVPENEPLFKTGAPPVCKPCEPVSPINMTSMNLSRRSLGSPGLNETKTYSTSPFCKYTGQSPSPRNLNITPNNSLNKSLNASMNGSLTGEGLIQSEAELQAYLKEVAERERKTAFSTNIDQPSNLLSSFWSHPATRSPSEISPMLRRCAYQLSPTVDKTKSSSPGTEEGTSPRGLFGTPDIWRKYRVESNRVNQWTANLRLWISKTVVERVAIEIDNVSAALVRHGLSDSQPGNVGLDRLRKLTQSQFVAGIPTLPTLVSFLELSNNQDYLVKRIKLLAKGGSMSEFKWGGGGSHNGKPWDNSLPTDTAIIMHLFSSYMDTQLEAPLDQPDARTFTSRYMAKSGSELPRTKGPIIVSQSANPPHYCLALSGDSLPADYEEIPRGRNNMFHTLLLFLYIIKTRDDGMLGRVNLGMSGINILWVIDD